MKAPDFWRRRGAAPALLAPLACLWRAGGLLERGLTRPEKAPIPVICVGNLTTGGTGKTPVVLALARRLQAAGKRPHILTRGYGGRLKGPLRVDPARHAAAEVGDEALLAARAAPTWIARDRRAGARDAAAAGAQVLLLDDGFQDPALVKDVALVVVDGTEGFGNGRLVPAGPLREPVAAGLARADAILLMGADTAGVAEAAARLAPHLPLLRAHLAPTGAEGLRGARVFGFAGIGHPRKFEATLHEIGCEVAGFRAFADHHAYTREEADALLAEAKRLNAKPVTTAKDEVRLPEALREEFAVVEVEARFANEAVLEKILTVS